jgi:hypothetical protein
VFGVRGPSPAHLIDLPELSKREVEVWCLGEAQKRLSDMLMLENGSATGGFALWVNVVEHVLACATGVTIERAAAMGAARPCALPGGGPKRAINVEDEVRHVSAWFDDELTKLESAE